MEPAVPASWRAIVIGPGGLPPEQVRPSGPDADRSSGHDASIRPMAATRPGLLQRQLAFMRDPAPMRDPALVRDPAPVRDPARVGNPALMRDPDSARNEHWADAPVGFGRGEAGGRRRRVLGALAVLVAVLTAVGLGVWADAVRPGFVGRSVVAATGDCLQADGAAVAAIVDCGSPAASFRVVAKFAGNADGSACSAAPSDVVLVTREPAALCLDYVAAVGDCLFSGPGTSRIGKIACTATQAGVFRVSAVLGNTIDPHRCPAGTVADLVHLHDSEVICLARP